MMCGSVSTTILKCPRVANPHLGGCSLVWYDGDGDGVCDGGGDGEDGELIILKCPQVANPHLGGCSLI